MLTLGGVGVESEIASLDGVVLSFCCQDPEDSLCRFESLVGAAWPGDVQLAGAACLLGVDSFSTFGTIRDALRHCRLAGD